MPAKALTIINNIGEMLFLDIFFAIKYAEARTTVKTAVLISNINEPFVPYKNSAL